MKIQSNISFDNTEVAFSYKSDDELKNARFVFGSAHYQLVAKLGTNLIKIALKLGLPIKYIVKRTIFKHFCGGETLMDCKSTVMVLKNNNVGTILDYSVEGGDDEKGFDQTCQEILQNIKMSKDFGNPFSVFKVTGLASTPLLEKVQKGDQLSENEKESFNRIRSRVERICQAAFDHQVSILIDAEETWIQDTIDNMADEMMERFNKDRAIVYNTYQMYRVDMLNNLNLALKNAIENNYYIGAKLVRGAYMEKERDRAEDLGYSDPIQPDKLSCDRDFNIALNFCLDNKQKIYVLCGSHNEYSNLYLTELMDKHGMENDDDRVFFGQLYGMSDNISFNLAKEGYNIAKYLPYGPIKSVMPYLFRRADENSSVAGQTSRELHLVKVEIKRRRSLR